MDDLPINERGEKVLTGSRRPDGTLRKERRIRPGYTPQDEMPAYVPTAARVSWCRGQAAGRAPRRRGAASGAASPLPLLARPLLHAARTAARCLRNRLHPLPHPTPQFSQQGGLKCPGFDPSAGGALGQLLRAARSRSARVFHLLKLLPKTTQCNCATNPI